jgi:endonuclease/exonuclease/phosphatase family metal-dependent hydrolase
VLTSLLLVTALSAATAAAPREDPVRRHSAFDDLPAPTGRYKLGSGRVAVVQNASASAPETDRLTVMSYNIYLGGRRREALLQDFDRWEREKRLPDVIGLQEANQEIAGILATRYRMHLVYHGRDADPLVNGKAFLTRHAIRDGAHFTYAIAPSDREAAIKRRRKVGELAEDRGALRVRISYHGREVDFYNVHHTVGSAGINAEQVRQLASLVRASRGRGADVVVLGDFNTNLNIRSEGHPEAIGPAGRTRTVAEYLARYGALSEYLGDPVAGVGNAGDPDVRAQMAALRDMVADLGDAEGQDGAAATQDIVDGATFIGLPDAQGRFKAMGHRIDAILATPELVPERFAVDREAMSSDHLPIVGSFR